MESESALAAQHLNMMFSPKFAVPIFGFVVPPLSLIILVTNLLMVWTLRKRNMRSPINAILTSVAVTDTLAICMPVVPFMYFYTLGHYEDFIPYTWCRTFFNLVHVFPLLCNMASLWSTVALAGIRCYSVWRPLQVKSVVTNFRINSGIVAIYLTSFIVYCPVIFEYSYTPISAYSMIDQNKTITSCHMQKSSSHMMNNFCTIHTWIQIILTSLLPWLLIAFPDFGLLWKLRHAENLVTANMNRTTRRRMTSWMIFVVVSMVWLVEIPFAITFTEYLSHTNGDVMRNKLGDNVVFVFLLKYITYPIIFVIYCFMSQRFRTEFLGMFTLRRSIQTRNSTEKSDQSKRISMFSASTSNV
ncbi:sex peptide receptor-like [Mya arenaria]|uniref:sex peptide receptor-like n=1 Tax=Mya arenaria TaxID=6604 RepID=UPI0022E09144|nr:sex peptide receptor-like [Mya arenaria]XP_052808658.1 sex peptide receptor-like [Mya arenaria]